MGAPEMGSKRLERGRDGASYSQKYGSHTQFLCPFARCCFWVRSLSVNGKMSNIFVLRCDKARPKKMYFFRRQLGRTKLACEGALNPARFKNSHEKPPGRAEDVQPDRQNTFWQCMFSANQKRKLKLSYFLMRQLYVTLGSLYSFMWRQCHVYGPVRFRHKKHLFWQKKNT